MITEFCFGSWMRDPCLRVPDKERVRLSVESRQGCQLPSTSSQSDLPPCPLEPAETFMARMLWSGDYNNTAKRSDWNSHFGRRFCFSRERLTKFAFRPQSAGRRKVGSKFTCDNNRPSHRRRLRLEFNANLPLLLLAASRFH